MNNKTTVNTKTKKEQKKKETVKARDTKDYEAMLLELVRDEVKGL